MMTEPKLLDEIRDDFKKAKESPKVTVKKPEKKRKSINKGKVIFYITTVIVFLVGVAAMLKYIADWGAEHQIVRQPIIAQWIEIDFPYRVEKIEKQIIIEPIVQEEIVQEFSTTEQKIVDIWGFKSGIVAIAIFDCGESSLDQYAVSRTGDLGIAQINWPIWKDPVKEKFGYNAGDMFDVDRNLEVAYWIWDRGDGKEGNNEGSWEAWAGFTSGGYTRCFNR